ncbi:hypothetical protein GQ600_2426 [Phytophthora cactorum]|nr:hypothetical protein GQ600_2426 [Phytophthora cactorum]
MQKQVENQLALSIAAFTKGARSADNLPLDASVEVCGARILCSMLYSFTNTQEIAATVAALFLRCESPFWFSHDVVFVNPFTLLISTSLTEDVSIYPDMILNGKPPKRNDRPAMLRKYWMRQPELETVWFCSSLRPV